MNWFTVDYIERKSVAYKQEHAADDSCCPHVEQDPSCAAYNRKEMDTFGPVATYVCCEACNAEAEEREGEELITCHDCGQEVKAKDALKWKWYDFYAPSGDEPLDICKACWVKEKHVERRRKDQADYDAEFPPDNDD